MGRGSKANYRGMCRERIQLMEAIGFKWKVSNPKERSDNSDAKNEEEDDDGNDNLKPKAAARACKRNAAEFAYLMLGSESCGH